MLLTNGGGSHERERAKKLSQELEVDITQEMVVQSHSPFEDLHDLKDKTVLVLGGIGDNVRGVAEQYEHSSQGKSTKEAHNHIGMASAVSSLLQTLSLHIQRFGHLAISSPTTTRTSANLDHCLRLSHPTTLPPHSRLMLSLSTMTRETGDLTSA